MIESLVLHLPIGPTAAPMEHVAAEVVAVRRARRQSLTATKSAAVHGMLDGLFQQTLHADADAEETLDLLVDEVRILPRLLVRGG